MQTGMHVAIIPWARPFKLCLSCKELFGVRVGMMALAYMHIYIGVLHCLPLPMVNGKYQVAVAACIFEGHWYFIHIFLPFFPFIWTIEDESLNRVFPCLFIHLAGYVRIENLILFALVLTGLCALWFLKWKFFLGKLCNFAMSSVSPGMSSIGLGESTSLLTGISCLAYFVCFWCLLIWDWLEVNCMIHASEKLKMKKEKDLNKEIKWLHACHLVSSSLNRLLCDT